jgi:hypothetical protein
MEAAKKIDDAINFIHQVHEELKNGNMVVLEGFQDEIQAICTDIAKLPSTETAPYQDKLTALADGLQVLEVELRSKHAEVRYEIMELNKKQNALKSYQQTNYSTPAKGETEGKKDGN